VDPGCPENGEGDCQAPTATAGTQDPGERRHPEDQCHWHRDHQEPQQSEALAAYRDARQFLNDEFGIEPGERLQALHQRILRGDPSLAGPAHPDHRDSGRPTVADVPDLTRTDQPLVPDLPPTPVPSLWSVPVPSPGVPGVVPPSRPPATWGIWLARVVGVLIPVASFGVFTWAVVAYLAGRRNSWRLGLAAAGYFALFGVMCAAIPAINAEGGAFRTADAVLVFAMFLSMIGGAVHVAVLDPGRPDQVRSICNVLIQLQGVPRPGSPQVVPDCRDYTRQARKVRSIDLAKHPSSSPISELLYGIGFALL
jgi:hypothetical protein